MIVLHPSPDKCLSFKPTSYLHPIPNNQQFKAYLLFYLCHCSFTPAQMLYLLLLTSPNVGTYNRGQKKELLMQYQHFQILELTNKPKVVWNFLCCTNKSKKCYRVTANSGKLKRTQYGRLSGYFYRTWYQCVNKNDITLRPLATGLDQRSIPRASQSSHYRPQVQNKIA